jgi:predicted transposase/invertase (TIGR01784 family)
MSELLDPTNDGNILQMNLIELNKADRLGLPEGPLRAWIIFFKHWREELTMAKVAHEPVQRAMSRVRELSADEEARRLAFVRERALRDEVSLLNEARREGEQEGLQKGLQEGRQENARSTALNLLKLGVLTDEQIAETTGLSVAEVKALQSDSSH